MKGLAIPLLVMKRDISMRAGFYLQTNRQEFILLFRTSVLQRRFTDSSGSSGQVRPCRPAEAAHRPPRRKAVDRSGKTRPIYGTKVFVAKHHNPGKTIYPLLPQPPVTT